MFCRKGKKQCKETKVPILDLAKKTIRETLDQGQLKSHFTINQATEPELFQDPTPMPKLVQTVTQNLHSEHLSLLLGPQQNHLLCLAEILLDLVMEQESPRLDQAEALDQAEQDLAKASTSQNLSVSPLATLKRKQK